MRGRSVVVLGDTAAAEHGLKVRQAHLRQASCLPSENHVSLAPTPNGFLVSFAGVPGRGYQVQRSTNLVTWNNPAPLVAPLHGIIEYEDTSPPPGQAFYRALQP